MIRRPTRSNALKTACAAALACLVGLTSGCARESTTATVRPDGSWTRKTVYGMASSEGNSGGQNLKIRDLFTPPAGPGWRVEEKRSGEKPPRITITATREVVAGQTIDGDLTVKAPGKRGKTASSVVNAATVRSAGPGRWIYTETFHWTGPAPDLGKDMTPLLASVNAALPPAVASGTGPRLFVRTLERRLWTALFSPPEPVLLDFYSNMLPIPGFGNPDERTELITRRLGPEVETALSETFGPRLSRDQRHQAAIRITRRIAEDTGERAGNGAKLGGTAGTSPGADSATETFGGMYPVAISVIVKLPGRVLETNGRTDALMGEVFWTLYPQAALTHDVVLRAVFEGAGRERVSTGALGAEKSVVRHNPGVYRQ